jgi:hypothetical protein
LSPGGADRCLRGAAALAVAASLLAGSAAGQTPTAPADQLDPDLSLLVDAGLAFARARLTQPGATGELLPFAFVVRADGKLQRIAPSPGKELPGPESLIELLGQAFRDDARTGAYRAVAIFADVVIALPDGAETDAIQVGLESASGRCADVYFPYTRTEGGLRFREPISGARTAVVFERCAETVAIQVPAAREEGGQP